MKILILGIVLAVLLAGCSEREKPAVPKPSGDAKAGKAVAERECKTCHGLDGRGVAPGIPHLAAQRERYLLLALTEYKEVKRTHAALRELAGRLTGSDLRNVVAYYASQPAVPAAPERGAQQASLLDKGKALAAACVKCHGEEGNSRTPGIPSLAGQQPQYLVTAVQEYHRGERRTAPMEKMLRNAGRRALESLALYLASRTPAQRPPPARGDPAAGQPLTAM
ncbi:MAG: c-type cytochrome, partial [Burkholderiales bacterium]